MAWMIACDTTAPARRSKLINARPCSSVATDLRLRYHVRTHQEALLTWRSPRRGADPLAEGEELRNGLVAREFLVQAVVGGMRRQRSRRADARITQVECRRGNALKSSSVVCASAANPVRSGVGGAPPAPAPPPRCKRGRAHGGIGEGNDGILRVGSSRATNETVQHGQRRSRDVAWVRPLRGVRDFMAASVPTKPDLSSTVNACYVGAGKRDVTEPYEATLSSTVVSSAVVLQTSTACTMQAENAGPGQRGRPGVAGLQDAGRRRTSTCAKRPTMARPRLEADQRSRDDQLAQDSARQAHQAARGTAKRGDIFTPEIAHAVPPVAGARR